MMSEEKISKCRSCGADIIWIKMASGKMMPCNAVPIRYRLNFASGKLTLVTPDGKIARGDADPVSGERVGYQSHFATCPYAAQHRRRGS